MFKSARLKLTAWYLSIIIIISLAFSCVIYQVISHEVESFVAGQRLRLERRFGQLPPQLDDFNLELIQHTKWRLLIMLTAVNGGIILVAGGVGYFLAGRTLEPIKQMVEEQNRFISDASHELRTPLTSLKSSMEVSLRDSKFSLDEARQLISDNIDDVDKLQSLSDQLLQLACYQTPGNQIKFEKFDSAPVIVKTISKIKPLAQKKHIKILSHLHTPQNIYAHPSSLSELIFLLLDNAIKYSRPNTTIKVTSSNTDNTAEIKVSDQGIGIGPKDISHIFNRFYRADAARAKQKIGGYGLGLAIAKKIIDSYHGSITVHSQIGHGSTFVIHLPISA